MKNMIHPVLLCGGAGSRLWPLSRKSFPKQFVKLTGEESLFQKTARRLKGECFFKPTVLTASDFRFMAIEQLTSVEVVPRSVIIEPSSKNTAASICVAALELEMSETDALMLVAPSDHIIQDTERFIQTTLSAKPAAEAGQIVTFGIRPDRAETGYGWLELSEEPDENSSPQPIPLRSFVEKPIESVAEKLFAGGMHLWNSGIFLFTTTAILDAFRKYAPEILEAAQSSLEKSEQDLWFKRLNEDAWNKLPNISIDFTIMEHAPNLCVIPYRGVWSDLGDWQAIWREGSPDENGVVTKGPVTALDCSDTFIFATEENQQVLGVGLKDVIAVAMQDAVLVMHKNCIQEVKSAVMKMKEQGVPQAEKLTRDYRPWGWYESLALGSRFQVKRIVVSPGSALSLQSHNHRSEHWIIVEGTAKVTVDDQVKLFAENQSVYIPLGAIHRLENPGKVNLTLIEVQTGTYLEEDDIIRYEDLYARAPVPKS